MAKNNDDIATIAYMKGFEDGRDAEAKKAANQCRAALSQIAGPLLAEAHVEELRQQLAAAEARIKELEDERGHVAGVKEKSE